MSTVHTCRTKTGMETKRISPIQAIRRHCQECVCWVAKEVELCQSPNCCLFPFRFGKDPGARPRRLTPEQNKILQNASSRARVFKNAGHRTDGVMV